MNIVFWGTPKYAAENLTNIVKAGHNVVAVVTQPDKKRSRGRKLSPSPVKQAAINLGIAVYETHSISKDLITKNILYNLKADVYIVVAFGQILPREILDQPTLGCWNSHASLLPIWRGAAPIQWSIINNDLKTGVCIMSMEEGLDTGPVIEQESTEISDKDNLEILTNRLSKISSKLLVRALERIKTTKGLNKLERLKKLNSIDQSILNGKPSYARQIKKKDYLIDWNQKARQIIKTIQGLYPNAYTFYNGKRIKIIDAVLLDDKNKSPINELKDYNLSDFRIPGEIIMINRKDGIFISTKDLAIIIRNGQLEGKNKTDGYTLAIQSNLSIHDVFEN